MARHACTYACCYLLSYLIHTGGKALQNCLYVFKLTIYTGGKALQNCVSNHLQLIIYSGLGDPFRFEHRARTMRGLESVGYLNRVSLFED
jgi:hypothetical protein